MKTKETKKKVGRPAYPLKDILEGKYPQYGTYALKARLIDEGIFKDECSVCGWNKKLESTRFTPCELDHIDGDPHNHVRDNLRLLCPNCHSLTHTYRKRKRVEGDDYV